MRSPHSEDTQHRLEVNALSKPHISSYATGVTMSEKPQASVEHVSRGRQALQFFSSFPLFVLNP